MENIFIKSFNLKELDTSDSSVFTPLKMILKSDSLFSEITKENIRGGQGFIEHTLSITQIFPSGLNNGWLNDEFGFTFAGFDYVSSTLEFIKNHIDPTKNKLINFMEETRASFQNFLISLINRSYYSAYFEMRRITEACIWLKHIEGEGDVKVEKLDELGTLTSQFQAYAPNLLGFWVKASEMLHNKSLVKFNWDNSGDVLKETFEDFQSCAHIAINSFKEFFKSNFINCNDVMRRYNLIWDGVFKTYAQPGYELSDKPITYTGTPEPQKILYAMYERLKRTPNNFEIIKEVDSYKSKLSARLKNAGHDFGDKVRVGHPLAVGAKLNSGYLTSLMILNDNSNSLSLVDIEKIYSIVTDNSDKRIFTYRFQEVQKSKLYQRLYKDVIRRATDLTGRMLKLELSGVDKEENLLKARLIMEDILFNTAIGSAVDGSIINCLCIISGYKPNFSIAQYRHISIVDRIVKASNREEVMPEFENNKKFIDVIFKCLEKLIAKYN